MAVRTTADLMARGMPAIIREPDFEVARDAFPASLKTVEVFLESDPDNKNLLLMLAQGWASYTQIVLEDEIDLAEAASDLDRSARLKARAGALYERAQGYAGRWLGEAVRRDLEDQRIDRVQARLMKLGKAEVPGLFWYAMAGAGRINMDPTNPARLSELPRVEAIVGRTVELDGGYFHGLPFITAGALAASKPVMFGGDPARAKAMFESAVAASAGRFLLAKFMYARYYAVMVGDHNLFCRLLREVLDAPSDLMPEQQLMNNVSKRWAARWIGRASSLFEDGGDCPAKAAPAIEKEVDDGSLE